MHPRMAFGKGSIAHHCRWARAYCLHSQPPCLRRPNVKPKQAVVAHSRRIMKCIGYFELKLFLLAVLKPYFSIAQNLVVRANNRDHRKSPIMQ